MFCFNRSDSNCNESLINMNNSTSYSLNKVPLVTLFFWIIKIMATTVGETAADYLNFNLKLGLGWTSPTFVDVS